jgi:ubiquitin-activating enzyme E1
LHDDGNVELWDLSSNFFLSESDVGQNRAQACVQKLQELNNAVLISALTGDLTKEQLSKFQVRQHEIDLWSPSLLFHSFYLYVPSV